MDNPIDKDQDIEIKDGMTVKYKEYTVTLNFNPKGKTCQECLEELLRSHRYKRPYESLDLNLDKNRKDDDLLN